MDTVILEIRAAEGGEDAKLLVRMSSRTVRQALWARAGAVPRRRREH